MCSPRGGGSDRNHVSLDKVRRRGRDRGVSGRGRARLSPKRGRGLTAITCPWIHLETWERQGCVRTGSRPFVTQAREKLVCNHVPLDTVRRRGRGRGVSGRGRARLSPKSGRGLTAITCPWIQFGDVGEAGGVSLRSLHFGRCCGCLPLRWRATFDNSVCQPFLAVSFLIHFLAARPAVFHCCCLFCHALCFCLASLFLYPVMWFEQLK